MTQVKYRTVMVVDDDESIRAVVARILEKHGYRMLHAANGLEALDQLRAGAGVDLMILDITMPEMDGYKTLWKLKDLGCGDLPVVMLSAKSMDTDVTRGYRVGADYYITKPFKAETVLRIVDYLIGEISEPERVELEAHL